MVSFHSVKLGHLWKKILWGKEWLWRQRLPPSGPKWPNLWSFYILAIDAWLENILRYYSICIFFLYIFFFLPSSLPLKSRQPAQWKYMAVHKAEAAFRSFLPYVPNSQTSEVLKRKLHECRGFVGTECLEKSFEREWILMTRTRFLMANWRKKGKKRSHGSQGIGKSNVIQAETCLIPCCNSRV